jgi:hypothetical protein
MLSGEYWMSRRGFFNAAAGLSLCLFILVSCNLPVISTSAATAIQGSIPFPATLTPTLSWPLLVRPAEITKANYGSQVTLFVGDSFVLQRIEDDFEPLNIDSEQVLQAQGDLRASTVVLKAMDVGTARLSTLLQVPCPSDPHNCYSPEPFTYHQVTVAGYLQFVPLLKK